jgi:hypothetical protein
MVSFEVMFDIISKLFSLVKQQEKRNQNFSDKNGYQACYSSFYTTKNTLGISFNEKTKKPTTAEKSDANSLNN